MRVRGESEMRMMWFKLVSLNHIILDFSTYDIILFTEQILLFLKLLEVYPNMNRSIFPALSNVGLDDRGNKVAI